MNKVPVRLEENKITNRYSLLKLKRKNISCKGSVLNNLPVFVHGTNILASHKSVNLTILYNSTNQIHNNKGIMSNCQNRFGFFDADIQFLRNYPVL
jgi:hypothetical protein